MAKAKAKKTAAKKTAVKAKPKKAAAPAWASEPDMTGLIDLTPQQSRALMAPREGFEEQLQALFATYTKYSDELGTLPMTIDEANARLARYEDLADEQKLAEAAVAVAAKHLEMVQETRRTQASKVWTLMLDIYARGKQAGKSNPALAQAIEGFAKFMATGPRPAVTEDEAKK